MLNRRKADGRVAQRGQAWLACAVGALALIAIIAGAGKRVFAASDIVLYASDFTRLQGNWSTASSSTGAGGELLSSPDAGWSSTSAALAGPSNFVEATFTAPSNTNYHVWLRLRASNDSKYNDSVFVQFSDALNSSGSTVYPIGSTGGLLVNLENCNACGVSSWGWQDQAYWLQQTNVVKFAGSSTHTIRIQTREDGVQVDQVVLSPATYLTSAPGPVKNDTHIVPKSASSGSTPYTGTAAAIPGTIQVENFDNGADGVAYHDTSSGNSGTLLRQTDVDIERSSAGGYDVGWVSAGEWLNYTVNVTSAGSYTVGFRVASLGQGGTFHLTMNGTNVTGAVTIPNTGGWQTWQTVTKTVTLSAGTQTARLVMDSLGSSAVGNFDWMQFTASTPASGTPAAPNTPNPPNGATDVTRTPNLSWKASGATSYDVRVGTSNPPPTIVSNITNYWYGPPTLTGGVRYYWQIVAKNSAGSTTGPVWSFTTAGSSTPPPPPPPPPPPGGSELIVAHWNIKVNSTESHARTVIDYLAALSPQHRVLVLAEAESSLMSAYLDELQNRTPYTWTGLFRSHCPVGKLSGGSCSGSENEGVVVLSSLPIVSSSSTLLPYADAWHSARAAVRVAVNVNGTTVQVFGVHLQSNNSGARYASMAFFKTWANGFSKPQLVGGDFNADQDQIDSTSGMSPNFIDSWTLVGSGRGFTSFTPSPTMKLDYWFAASGGKATPNWSSVVTATGTVSDHFPVHASFTVRP